MRAFTAESRDDLRELAGIIRRELIRSSTLTMGRTAPNPPVACVVAERMGNSYRLYSGATEPVGGRHAEIVALDAFDQSTAPRGDSRMYVTLEPCSRFGRTPPCTRRILKYASLRRIVVGCADPSLEGSGVGELRAADIPVGRVHADIAWAFLDGFVNRIQGRGPRLHLKAAITGDNYMSAGPGERLMVSGSASRDFTMLLRRGLDGVLVGPGTMAGDLPGLDLRPLENIGTGTDAAAHRPTYGSDLLCESFLNIAAAAPPKVSSSGGDIPFADDTFQPRRLFLLGHPFPGLPDFLEKQCRLARATGRPAELIAGAFPAEDSLRELEAFAAPENEILLHDHRRDFANFGSPGFGRRLRDLLGELGLNEVLVEGGPGLLSSLKNEMRSGDRVYILKSPKMLLDNADASGGHNSGGKKIPAYLLELPIKARFSLGEDELTVREIP